ncbi:MAG: sensor domain-containing diguanylate cyclase [Azospirillaceae bacterium]|nr:sensor domain-containing diguanylate cyclase [Azospirillaceae bacterium]
MQKEIEYVSSSFYKSPLLYSVLTVLFIMLLGSGYSIYGDYRSTVGSRYALVRDISKLVEDNIRRTVGDANAALNLADKMIERAGGLSAIADREHWQQLREIISDVDGGMSLWVFDHDGKVVLESGQFPARRTDATDREFFQTAINTNTVHVGQALRGRVSGSIFYTISRPYFNNDDTFQGVIAIAMDTNRLTNFYAMMNFGFEPLIEVIRVDGSIVARRPDLDHYLDRSTNNSDISSIDLHVAEGQLDYVSPMDHVERLAAYRRLPDYDLIILAGVANGMALNSWRIRTTRTAAITAVSALLSLVAFGVIFRTLRRSRRTRAVLIRAAKEKIQITTRLTQARHDGLTGLPSRNLWLEMADATVARCRTEQLCLAFLFIDLDNFKAVNDRHGHDQGDRVLKAVAEILRVSLRETDIAGRLGGDEFAIFTVAPGTAIRQKSQLIADRIIEKIKLIGFGIGCSIGVSVFPVDCTDLSDALLKADNAMYVAKRLGKCRCVFYEETIKTGIS